MDALAAVLAPEPRSDDSRELYLVDGWLVVDAPHTCARIGPNETPCPAPPPFLAVDRPTDDGLLTTDRGTTVTLGDALGIDPGATVTRGPFLLAVPSAAQCADPAFDSVFAAACAAPVPGFVVVAQGGPQFGSWVDLP